GKAGYHHDMVEVGTARQYAGVFAPVVDQVIVDLVTDHIDATVGRFLDDGLHGFPGIKRTGGVARGVEHDGAGVVVDGVDDRFGVQLMVLFGMGGNGFD